MCLGGRMLVGISRCGSAAARPQLSASNRSGVLLYLTTANSDYPRSMRRQQHAHQAIAVADAAPGVASPRRALLPGTFDSVATGKS
jgi:hypothetical protein